MLRAIRNTYWFEPLLQRFTVDCEPIWLSERSKLPLKACVIVTSIGGGMMVPHKFQVESTHGHNAKWTVSQLSIPSMSSLVIYFGITACELGYSTLHKLCVVNDPFIFVMWIKPLSLLYFMFILISLASWSLPFQDANFLTPFHPS